MTLDRKNVMILTTDEEQMQGIIRGIEALDVEHKIGIIHGAFDSDKVQEVPLIMAELADATIIHTPEVQEIAHPQGKKIDYYTVDVPKAGRDEVIQYINDYYGTIVSELLEDIPA